MLQTPTKEATTEQMPNFGEIWGGDPLDQEVILPYVPAGGPHKAGIQHDTHSGAPE